MWISFAQFELSVPPGEEQAEGAAVHLTRTRAVYQEANRQLKACQDREERLMLLESWKEFEVSR